MKNIPVFYTDLMVVDKKQESPSPKKPKEVVKQWSEKYHIEIKTVKPVSTKQIKEAHENSFVEGILTGQLENGFGSKDKEVIDSLPYTSGSFLSAAKEALKTNLVAVSPTSGFHHAEHDKAMGYCTFNGLMIAAIDLLNNKWVDKIGILDCDHHYGNGTDDIIIKLQLQDKIKHITARKSYPYKAEEFLKELPNFLNQFKEEGVDIIFYQAGVDCHLDDPYGGFLTTEQIRLRDKIVFDFCKKNRIALVWNLAGGYQEETLADGNTSIQKVLDLHNNTMKVCEQVYLGK